MASGERDEGAPRHSSPYATETYRAAAGGACGTHTTDQWATGPSEAVRGLLLYGLRGRHSTIKVHVCILITHCAFPVHRPPA